MDTSVRINYNQTEDKIGKQHCQIVLMNEIHFNAFDKCFILNIKELLGSIDIFISEKYTQRK